MCANFLSQRRAPQGSRTVVEHRSWSSPAAPMVNTRTLVSYDDITPPEPSSTQLGSPLPSAHPPPAKKRRTQQKAPPRRNAQPVQHWDDPSTPTEAMNYGSDSAVARSSATPAVHGGDGGEEAEEDSRELTHEEIWDDSALIDAWDSAIAEYEVSEAVLLSCGVFDASFRPSMAKARIGSRMPSRNRRCECFCYPVCNSTQSISLAAGSTYPLIRLL